MSDVGITSVLVNPFPAFAVEKQFKSRVDFERVSVETRPRKRLLAFLNEFADGRVDNCNIGIKGDYGTGKTHLLRYAEAFFEEQNENRNTFISQTKLSENEEEVTDNPDDTNRIDPYYCTFVECRGRSFSEFFCKQLAPAFGDKFLEEIARRFLALHASTEASRLPVTEGAAEALKDYTKAETVLRSSLLPEGRIIESLRQDIARLSGSADVARVVSQLADSNSSAAAYRWLSLGVAVEDSDLQQLGLRNRLDSDETALAAVRAVAGIMNAIGKHWIVLIDQLEHLTRVEAAEGAENIQNSIKSFLTALVPGHGAIIAGHLSGWQVYEDFEKRFLQPIVELPKLNIDEARRLIKTYLEFHDYPDASPNNKLLATLLDLTSGNMRALLVLCHTLFRSLGISFGKATEQDLEKAFREMRDIRDREEIEDIVAKVLKSETLSFELQIDIKGVTNVSFAVPNRHAPRAFIMVESCALGDESAQLQRLVDRGLVLHSAFPDARVMIIVTGYVTRLLLGDLRKIQFDVFDATAHSFEHDFARAAISLMASKRSTTAPRKEEPAEVDSLYDSFGVRAGEERERAAKVKEALGSEPNAPSVSITGPLDTGIDVARLFPSGYSPLRYVGTITWALFAGCSACLMAGVLAESLLDVIYDPVIFFFAKWWHVILPFWLAATVLFYFDWRVAHYVIEQALSIREQKQSEGEPTYRILRREREIMQRLGIAAFSVTWLQRHVLAAVVDHATEM